jgi:transcriptional regulator GlxA family with amidase domain
MHRPSLRSPLAAVLALLLALLATACRPRADQERRAAASESPAAAPAAPAPPPAVTPATGEAAAPDPEGWKRIGPAPDLPADRPLRAAFLVVDGVYNTELMAPYDVFQHTVFHTKPRPGIEVFTVSPDGRPVRTFEGLQVTPHHSFATAPPIDILVVPSAEGSMDRDLQNRTLIDWVQKTGAQARWVVSLCDGAFVLAQAGLLDGIAATTFPDDYQRFAETFPKVDLRINVSYVEAGKFLTSQGGTRSYTVALRLVDLLYGEQVARRVGHGLLIDWPPAPAAAVTSP